jgi:hypothetical protein
MNTIDASLFSIAVQFPKLDVATLSPISLLVHVGGSIFFFRLWVTGCVRGKCGCGMKPELGIDGDIQGLLGQCALATVAILGTLAMLNL